jgi:TolB-like protein/Flp pilus assembly protein TadD
MKIYKFRDWYLNPAERLVLKDGKYLDLTTKTFDVLQLLIENFGEIVTKDEILGKVWNGSFVEEGNLAVHISKLRRQLDESKNQPFIETVQGSGYRFVAPVQEVAGSEWENISSGIAASTPDKHPREWIFDSIAVLPLQNENGDDEVEYLTDGLTESFINSLSRLPNLKVIARNTVFRYKNKAADAKEVGETLGVATVLTGRVRIIKDRLTIGIELTKTKDGTHLWGTHFNRSFTDIFEIQESIIFEVLERLKSEISNVSKKYSPNAITKNSESYRLYLKGKYLLDKRTEDSIYKAIECFRKSISCDPINVYSYTEIAEAYGQLYVSGFMTHNTYSVKIQPFLGAISELNESVDVVQTLFGRITYFDWKLEEAEKHLQYALHLNPNSLIARYRYSGLLLAVGKYSQALKELNRIIQLDPLSFRSYLNVGRAFYRMGQYETAMIYLNDALDLEPYNYEVLAVLGATFAELGDYEKALGIFQKSLEVHYNVEILSMFGYIYALQGKPSKAYKIIKQIKTQFNKNCEFSTILARIYIALGEKEIAYELFDQAFEKHEADLIAIISDPRLAKITNDPKCKDLIKRIGISV